MVGIGGITLAGYFFVMAVWTAIVGVQPVAGAEPVEIDSATRVWTIKTPPNHPNFFNVKNPYFHMNGAVSFKTESGKEVIVGPAVPWIAVEQ